MVAVMLVNNEIGVIQPVAEIAAMAHQAGALMLCDAVQGFGRVTIRTDQTWSRSPRTRSTGPRRSARLWMRAGAEPAPLIHGGGQERACVGHAVAGIVRRLRRGR